VNRNTSRNAHTAKPAPPASSSTAAAHATACRVNKENRTANASIPAVSSAKGVCVCECVSPQTPPSPLHLPPEVTSLQNTAT